MSKDKVEELFRRFEKLSFEKNVISESGAHWCYIIYLLIALGEFILLGRAFLYSDMWTKPLMILMIILFIIGLILRISVANQCKECLKNSADFAVEFGGTTFTSSHTFNIIQIFLFHYSPNYEDYVYRKIRDDQIVVDALADEKLEDFISYLEEESSKKQFRNWLPVTLLAATIFPVWDGLVSFRYSLIEDKKLSEGISLFIEFIPWVIYLFFLIWFVTYVFEKILLSEVKNRKQLVKILRLIKING